ncbi:MAG: hypothetical protein ACTHJI_06130 [Leifsonia sp.]
MRIALADDLPRVPISAFKSNPVRYLETGALVTNHGKVRAAFVPIAEPDDALDGVKAQLRLLARMSSPEDVADELAELSAGRDSETVGDAR